MVKQKSNLYEGMYIISAVLSDEARSKTVERIESSITSRGGKIRHKIEMGRRRFAYPIDGKREGYYYLIYFDLNTNEIKEIRREYQLNEDLVRYMLLRTEHVQEKLEFKPLLQPV